MLTVVLMGLLFFLPWLWADSPEEEAPALPGQTEKEEAEASSTVYDSAKMLKVLIDGELTEMDNF